MIGTAYPKWPSPKWPGISFATAIALALTACNAPAPQADMADEPRSSAPSAASPSEASVQTVDGQDNAVNAPEIEAPALDDGPSGRLIAQDLVLAEWRKAENKAFCAPASFARTGDFTAKPRRANFAGGWSVAFDMPELRSAWGIAGTGHLPADGDAAPAKRAQLQKQWPYFRDLGALPQPAYAGYGLEGAKSFDMPSDGTIANALAYVRIGGQDCLYNVWSKMGRSHLELLLDNLRMVER